MMPDKKQGSESHKCDSDCIRPEKVDGARKDLPDNSTTQKVVEMFKALGDATRLKMLMALTKEELCVCELAKLLGLTISAISHQLRLLRTMNLVKFRKEGRIVFYSLDDEHIKQLIEITLDHVEHK